VKAIHCFFLKMNWAPNFFYSSGTLATFLSHHVVQCNNFRYSSTICTICQTKQSQKRIVRYSGGPLSARRLGPLYGPASRNEPKPYATLMLQCATVTLQYTNRGPMPRATARVALGVYPPLVRYSPDVTRAPVAPRVLGSTPRGSGFLGI
jgi:hypothetical protein